MLYLYRLTIQPRKEIPLNSISESPAIEVPSIRNKSVFATFDGGNSSSDAGILLLKEMEKTTGIINAMSAIIEDQRDQRYVDHSYNILVSQRVFQICAGYEDANDCNHLRNDPIFKLCANVLPDTDTPLASQPTMSRFENTPSRRTLYQLAYAFVDTFIASYEKEPSVIVLDFDDTEDTVHGNQQLSLFNAYVGDYCYMPLHIYEGLSGKLVCALLKPGKQLGGAGMLAILKRLVTYLRKHWKNTVIVFRGDCHFTAPEVMHWIEKQQNLYFVTGLTSNAVLQQYAEITVQSAKNLFAASQRKVTLFHSFFYQATTWHNPQRVVVKVEISPEHNNPNVRFIVSNMVKAKATVLYSQIYCARGNAELYIKDLKTYLKSDRTSCHRFLANQFRLFLHSAAYVLIHTLQRTALRATQWERATMQTIQLKLFKIGVRVKELTTRIKIELPSTCPVQDVLRTAFAELNRMRC